ncbi:hypothetical protein ACRALDRAFT_2029034 [Sodiomyces alcalophilus JCM 7366]|uniref:uncharacterized protein n=1 Tax=Sodiomyces alcalophilus JCM 7366 TaxID=591952 RepID=UPI0039B5B6C0
MSASLQAQREPLHDRSQPQTNPLAIRIVPYSPPRPSDSPSDDRVLSSATRHDTDDTCADDAFSHFQSRNVYETVSAPPSPGSPTSSRPFAAARGRPVSNPKVRPGSRPGYPGTHATPVSEAPTVSSRIPSDISPVHASPGADQGFVTFSRRPPSRRRNLVTVHPNSKTFSLQPQPGFQGAFRPSSSSLSTSSSIEQLSSFDWPSEGRPSSPLTTLPERSASPCTPGSHSAEWTGDQNSSPWNYRLVGGLRKVPETPDSKPSLCTDPPHTSSPASDPHLPALPEAEAVDGPRYHLLTNKTSFLSSRSLSTRSETTNYKVYAGTSPVVLDTTVDSGSVPLPSSRDSNYQILGRSSPPVPSTPDSFQPDTAVGDANYVIHGNPSQSSPSVVIAARRLRPEFSQESLVVPPLRPAKKKSSSETLASRKSRSSRLFHKASLTSISSVFGGQEAIRGALLSPVAWLYQPDIPPPASAQPHGSWTSGSSNLLPLSAQLPMVSYSRPWGSQPSTVASEGGEEASGLMSCSALLLSSPPRHRRGLSGGHGRLAPNTYSQPPRDVHRHLTPQSPAASVEEPMPTYDRGGMMLLVKDQDEHGDGLADLHQLHNRPSRRRLSSFLSNTSSDRNLHSSGSSRTNSFNTSSLPAWARLYYGSGEPRRWLRQATSLESMAGYNDTSRSSSSLHSACPKTENTVLYMYTHNQTSREVKPPTDVPRPLETEPVDLIQIPAGSIQRRLVPSKKTSSVWSPRLARDQRAIQYRIWEPPSVKWSGDGGFWGRRNIQFFSFVVGFIFPFAWMVASCLPLPHRPQLGESDIPALDGEQACRAPRDDDLEYRSCRWWRNLNRCMSVLGLLIIGAVIALAVVGVARGWSRS